MKYPQELQNFWADAEKWSKVHAPEDWPVSAETAELFENHLSRLQPVADSGDDYACYAMASIYLLELIYPDEATRDERFDRDRVTMTALLYRCSENGMVAAFDNLVTSGVGEIGDSARAAAKDYERDRKPDWDDSSGMPVYTPTWMESAMNLWKTRRGEQDRMKR